jgi:hypothetical protein
VLGSEAAGAVAAVVAGVPLIAALGVTGAALTTAVAYLVQLAMAHSLSGRPWRPRPAPAVCHEGGSIEPLC